MDINGKIEDNFRSIYSYIMERSGINLFDDQLDKQEDTFNESTNVLEGPNDSELSSEIFKIVGKTPEEIQKWMYNNISYDKTIKGWTLKTPAETFKTRTGNCHDQSLFESFLFHSLGIINGQLFFVEFSKNNPIGGNTHTLTWYRIDTPNEDYKYSYYWFENAWEDQAGIHGPYNDIGGLKHAILEIYKKDNDINSHKYDGIVFSTLSNYRCGMSLGEYVESWRLEDDHLFNESNNIPIVKTEIKSTKNPNDPESQEAVDITFFNDDGDKIGVASVSSVDTDHAFLYNVEVDPQFRGKGYGHSIMRYCLVNYQITELTVEPSNTIAIQLYEKYGFKRYMDWEENGRKLIDMRRDTSKPIPGVSESIEEGVKYFSVTHDGIGIYEAMRRQISAKSWKELLKSDAFTWLPKPKEYPSGCKSYFTKDGMDKFNEMVYPIAAGIVGDNIKIEKFIEDDIGHILYKDHYQVITSDNINDVINESLEWIERFVNDDEFRESVDEEPDSIDVSVGGGHDEPFVPIYGIIKSYSHSKLRNDGSQKSDSELNSVKFDKIIHMLTRGDNYSHALVSFDLSLTEMYSYEDEGFVVDNIMEKASWMGTKSIYICVMFVRKSERDRMKKFVEELKEHPEKTKYAMGNLIKAYIATPTKTDKRFVCSSFTGYIMACSNPKNLRRDYSRLRPDDITLLPRAFYVTNCIDREDFRNRYQEIKDRVKSIYEEYKEDIDDYNNHLPKIMLTDRIDKLKTIDKIFDWIVDKLA